jgi:hypothetical protein
MSAEADGTAPAAQPAGLSGASGSASALARMENWHHDVIAQVDGWGWIRTLNDQLTAVLAPWRERYQGNPVLELMHGGRWLGHPLHPALSDLPIGFWAGSMLLDLTSGDPTPDGGLDPAAMFPAAGIAAAVAPAATGVVDWTVSDDQDRRVGLFHGVLNTAALGGRVAVDQVQEHRSGPEPDRQVGQGWVQRVTEPPAAVHQLEDRVALVPFAPRREHGGQLVVQRADPAPAVDLRDHVVMPVLHPRQRRRGPGDPGKPGGLGGWRCALGFC